MDYARIYAAFIADRRSREPALLQADEYVERHHVLPRSLGGSNDRSNLISLTPEDHLFAHLVLAKIHGGKMWVAAHAMCHLYDDRLCDKRGFGNRELFGYARRAVAAYHSEIFRGPSGPQADKSVHVLHHTDGRSASGNRFELSAQTGVTRQQISAILRGAKKIAHGWYSKTHNADGHTRTELIAMALRSDAVHTLYHFDGRSWSGTRSDFTMAFGRKLDFQQDGGSVAGWYRTPEDASQHSLRIFNKARAAAASRGSISGEMNPNADQRSYTFLVIETGELVAATKWDAKLRFGLTSSGMCSLFSGRQVKTRGIALAQVKGTTDDKGRAGVLVYRAVPEKSGRAARRRTDEAASFSA